MSVHKGAPALLSAGTLCAALLLTGCASTATPAPAAPRGRQPRPRPQPVTPAPRASHPA